MKFLKSLKKGVKAMSSTAKFKLQEVAPGFMAFLDRRQKLEDIKKDDIKKGRRYLAKRNPERARAVRQEVPVDVELPKKMNFSRGLIRQFLRSQNTQEEIAIITGVHVRTVYKWMNSDRKPNIVVIDKLVKHFGCTADDLLYP